MEKKNLLIVGLISVTLISLELIWTRIFSAEFFYTFAFLVLSLAILGLGLGALSVHLFAFLRKEKTLGWILSATGLCAMFGPLLVFKINLDFSVLFQSKLMILKFILTVIILSSTYFLGGMGLAKIFRKNHPQISNIYMADLLGAGLGVIVAVLLMNWFGTPVATFLVSLPVLAAAAISFTKYSKTIPGVLIITMGLLAFLAPDQLQKQRKERAPVIYTHWDATAKVKIFDYGEGYRGINIDNAANSPVYPFDGNWAKLDSANQPYGIDVKFLMEQFDDCTFLSLGSGGGVDVLQALQYGADEVHAVEVCPHINKLMLEGRLAEVTGNLYKDPRVKVATEDARAYVRRYKNKFNMIYSLSSNSFAALASGAFALAENYLFTTEAFQDYWEALTEDGFMMMEHQFYMPRLVSELMQALEGLGVDDIKSHFAVYNLPMMRRKMVLISKRPLTDNIRNHAFGELTHEKFAHIHLLYPAVDSLKGNLYNQIVRNGWESVADSTPVDISPCNDNRPFVAQLGMWKNFNSKKLDKILPYEFFGFPLSKLIITITLFIIILLIMPLNLLPFFMKEKKLKAAPWLYFFIIGMGFMIIEIILIQKYALFIGASVYSLITILTTLLIASGIGSRFAPKFSNKTPFLGIIVWILLDILIFGNLTSALAGLTILPRIVITAILVAPLGFFMGMPFPKAALKVGELVDWGFAVNGAASTFGAVSIMLVVFAFGFNVGLILSALLYGIAWFLISEKFDW